MDNTTLKLDNAPLFTDFDNHISIEQNDRILFSAPFGTGKSTYLNEYFEARNDNYFCFNLYPVNYSVSQNEDVFELIKFDLLLQLLGNYKTEVDLQNEDFSNVLSFQALFLKEFKLTPLLLSFIGESGKVGKSAKILIDEVKKQYAGFKAKFVDEEKFIESYLTSIESKIGNVNEMDAYSSIISTLLERVQSKYENKKSVLIIDDLDRLDPEHIFRLFNIFSVNFGKDEILNKFGFDKIIFVCDIENIRNIYSHKYGQNVDFGGYIDKFYSIIPFAFDNKRLLKQSLSVLLSKLKGNEKNFNNNFFSEANVETGESFFTLTQTVVLSLLDAKQINLRNLLYPSEIRKISGRFNFSKHDADYKIRYDIIKLFEILRAYFGDLNSVREKLEIIEIKFDSRNFTHEAETGKIYNPYSYNILLSFCLPFIIEGDQETDKLFMQHSRSTETITKRLRNFESFIHFSISSDFNSRKPITQVHKITSALEIESEEVFHNPYEILLATYDECVRRKAFDD